MASSCEPSAPQTVGPMPGFVGRSDDHGAGAVAEDERRRAVLRVGEVGELLHADDQDVRRAPAADHVVGEAEAVAEAGAGGGQVERGGGPGAEPVGDVGGGGWGLQQVGDGRDHDGPDLFRSDAGMRERLAGRLDRHVGDRLVVAGPAPLDDAGALPIHSSVESMRCTISSLVTTREGR